MKNLMKVGTALLASLASSTAGAACNPDVSIIKPGSIYHDHGNGTVTDSQTGLMWMQCSQGLSGAGCATGTAVSYSWKQALEVAQTANSGAGTFGYTDWRLPNVKEIESLVELACDNPSINTGPFPATVSGWYWSSSLYPTNGSLAMVVSFNDSYVGNYLKSDKYSVRLVRGGQ